jgi:hypothetical protein
MLQNDLGPICRLGRIIMTPGVKKSLSGEDVLSALLRHLRDTKTDSQAGCVPEKLEGCRVLQAYRSRMGQCFWVITEADRTVTTVLMPEEF